MHIIKNFLLILCFSLFGIHAKSMDIDEDDITHAKTIANNIFTRQVNPGLDNIMNDHSEKYHASGDSYFKTDDPEEMENLIRLVVDDPDKFKFYNVRENYRLAISKKISGDEALKIFKTSYIGYDEKHSVKRFRVVLCFGINGMTKLSDSERTGVLLTGFPAREEYKLGL